MRTHPFARYSAALLLACLPCPAQQPGETPTFRTGTTLIEFTIVAMDSNGNPVTNLKQEEITITENGESREVAFLRFEGGVSDAPPPEPLPPGIFSNRPEYTPGPPRNVTAIVFDALNTQPSEQAWVRDQLKKYLRTTVAETRIAVYRMGRKRISLVHDFSDDTDLLLGRVDKIPTELPLVSYSSQEMESEWLRSLGQRFGGRDTGGAFERALAAARGGSQIASAHYQRMNQGLTLEYLLAIGDHLAGIPGRKSLVWFSGAFPVLTAQAGWLENDEFLIRNTLQHLASQGIVFYPVHAAGLQTPVHSASSPAGPPRLDPRGSLQFAGRSIGGMYIAAALTGGRVTARTNDLTEGLKAAADDLRGAYTAGFYAVGDPDNQWHTLHVAVKRPGVKLAHRQGYLSQAPAPQPLRWSHDHWRVAIASPIQSTAVRLDVLCEPVADTEAGAYDLC